MSIARIEKTPEGWTVRDALNGAFIADTVNGVTAAALATNYENKGAVMARCNVRQYSDECACESCGLRWDVKDPEPPTCGRKAPDDPAKFFDKLRSGLEPTAPSGLGRGL